MANTLPIDDFDQLSPEKQIETVQSLWERISERARAELISDSVVTEAERRLREGDQDPASHIPRSEVLERLRRRRE